MINANDFKTLQNRIDSILSVIRSYVEEEENRDILSNLAINTDDAKMYFKIGLEKFIFYWFFDFNSHKVFSFTYHWQFDDNSQDMYKRKQVFAVDMIADDGDSSKNFIRMSYLGNKRMKEDEFVINYFYKIKEYVNDLYKDKTEDFMSL